VSRGCRQGDPLSTNIFVLCAEILALKIRENNQIRGIKINDTEFKITQFADDTSMILDGSSTSLNETLKELAFYEQISGLKINFDKTQVVWIGKKKYSQDSINTRWKLSWGKCRFKILGINFNVDLSKMVEDNYKEKLVKLEKMIERWNKRHLTPMGKITVIKTLFLSMFNHLFFSIPNPSPLTIKKINDMFFKFLWEGPAKIKSRVIVKQYCEGGLKMINLEAFLCAIKTTWVRKFLTANNTSKWQIIVQSYLDANKMATFTSIYCEEIVKHISNAFWKDVISSFKVLIDKLSIEKEEHLLTSPIFHNKNFLIGHTGIFNKAMHNRGMVFVNDLVDEQGMFLSVTCFNEYSGLNLNFLQYHSIISCLNAFKKKHTIEVKGKIKYPFVPFHLASLLKVNKGCKVIYDILNQNTDTPTGKNKWNETYQIDDKTWKNIYENPFQITKDTKLQWFQVQIDHKILVTNSFLNKIKLIDSASCTFCKTEIETIQHLIWGCSETQYLITLIKQWFQAKNLTLNLDETKFLFGITNVGKVSCLDQILLEIRYYIYRTRCLKQKLYLNVLKARIKILYNIQKQLYLSKNEITKFNDLWGDHVKLIEN
ncbi:MAG: hypothetical protein KZQ70_14570, partial [gamma proteobacterium symbiont of Lucinoma myriamae]|nr:hypothetical protein [gamma proteobacterium symbiont of Lucinoma myriamae]